MALLSQMEELRMALRVEQEAAHTFAATPRTASTFLNQAPRTGEPLGARTRPVQSPEPRSRRREDPLQDQDSPLRVGLQATPFPEGFQTPKLSKFKGDSDPDEFTRSHALALEASRGRPATMAKCFPLALEGVDIR